MTPADISIVIPTINEVGSIAASIESATSAGAQQIIVVDGGSTDRTVAVARQAGASDVVQSDPGRGVQLNRGAALASGELILFLHADNQLGAECLVQLCEQPNVVWGGFEQQIDAPQRIYRAIEWGNAWRVSCRGIPFGDQAVFVRREAFHRQGGFAAIPFLEDLEFALRMRRIAKPVLLEGPVRISAHRWQQLGVLRQTIRNWMIQAAFASGVSAERLARFYRRSR